FAFARRHAAVITRIGGAMLICVGLLEVTGVWYTFISWLQTLWTSYDAPLQPAPASSRARTSLPPAPAPPCHRPRHLPATGPGTSLPPAPAPLPPGQLRNRAH